MKFIKIISLGLLLTSCGWYNELFQDNLELLQIARLKTEISKQQKDCPNINLNKFNYDLQVLTEYTYLKPTINSMLNDIKNMTNNINYNSMNMFYCTNKTDNVYKALINIQHAMASRI